MNKKSFFTAAILLIVQRFFHLYNYIENPHSWRQLDTVFYAYDYYKNGINLFKPSVSWLGNYKTLILEFPIISALMSFSYYLPGSPLIYMKLLSFIFFLSSAYLFYKIVDRIYDKRIAQISFIVYLIIPIGVYYSTAVIIDFAAMTMVLGALYYYILGYDNSNIKYITFGSIFCVFAYLIKIPYALIIYFPLAYYSIKLKNFKFLIKTLPLISIPFIIFIFWQIYSINQNGKAPDWQFIPDYFKFNNMSSWYFGDLNQRFNYDNWERFLSRSGGSLVTFAGFPLILFSIFIKLSNGYTKTFFNYLLIGSLVYLFIFFNLNVIHDYYQIPFLSIVSFYIAIPIDYLYRKFAPGKNFKKNIIVLLIFLVLIVNGIWFTERWYYKPDILRIEASNIIQKNSGQDDLIITSIEDTDPRDPRILSASYRYGWSIRTADLSSQLIDSLKNYNAAYLFIITQKGVMPNLKNYLSQYPHNEEKFYKEDWKIDTYKLK